MKPREAALACMGELFGALLATALVLMAVFVPVAFYPGGIGIIYKQFALTIAFSVAISAFNALTFSPMLSGLILSQKKPPEPKGRSWIVVGVIVGLAFGRFSAASFGNWTYIAGIVIGALAGSNLPLIFKVFNRNFERLETTYSRLLKRMIQARRIVLAGLVAGIVATGFAFTTLPTAFIPDEDQGYGVGIFQLQNGASLVETKKLGNQIAKVLSEEDDVANASIINGYGFNGSSPDQGIFFFGLQPLEERKGAEHSSDAIVKRLNEKLIQLSDGLARASGPPAVPGFSAQGGFYFQFNDLSNGAYSFNELSNLAGQLIKTADASGDFSSVYTQFTPSAPAIGLNINREVMGALNVDFKEAMDTISALAGNNFSGLTYESGQVRSIYVQGHAKSTGQKSMTFLAYYVRSNDGELVQVSQFAEAELSSAPPVISHYNLSRTVLIQGAEAIGKSSGQALSKIQQLFNAAELHQHWFSLHWSGSAAALRGEREHPGLWTWGADCVSRALSPVRELHHTGHHPGNGAPGHAWCPRLSCDPFHGFEHLCTNWPSHLDRFSGQEWNFDRRSRRTKT